MKGTLTDIITREKPPSPEELRLAVRSPTLYCGKFVSHSSIILLEGLMRAILTDTPRRSRALSEISKTLLLALGPSQTKALQLLLYLHGN